MSPFIYWAKTFFEPKLSHLLRIASFFKRENTPYPIWLKRYQQADHAVGCLCKVASQELHDGEGDDPDGNEDREEDPVELVEEAQVGPSLGDKAPLSETDEENSRTRQN